jgi:hypothetical protein
MILELSRHAAKNEAMLRGSAPGFLRWVEFQGERRDCLVFTGVAMCRRK